jgi:hypothetical protein
MDGMGVGDAIGETFRQLEDGASALTMKHPRESDRGENRCLGGWLSNLGHAPSQLLVHLLSQQVERRAGNGSWNSLCEIVRNTSLQMRAFKVALRI